MAIKIFCSVCDKFLYEVGKDEMSKIKDNEICPVCSGRIDKVFLQMDKAEKEFQTAIDKQYQDAKTMFNKFQQSQTQKMQEVKSIINNIRPEIDKIIREMLQEQKPAEPVKKPD